MVEAILDEGECLVREGRLEEARKFVQSNLTSINRARGHLLNTLGVIHARAGLLDRAKAFFELVVKDHPDVAQAKGNLENVCAEKARREALRLNRPA